HDRQRTEEAVFDIGDVHRTPLSACDAAAPTKQLRHQTTRFHSLRQRVPVSSVMAEDLVIRLQHGDHAHRDSLLPDRNVDGPGDLALFVCAVGRLFEAADGEHAREERDLQIALKNDGFRHSRSSAVRAWSISSVSVIATAYVRSAASRLT